MRFFVNVMYTFNLASRAFPKAKYSEVRTEFRMGSKFNFLQ